MIRLTDVKVAPQYRERVRHRLVVLTDAGTPGPTAAGRRYGISARSVGRWRKRWRAEGVKGLVPRYPHRRQRRVSVEVLELIRPARQGLGLWSGAHTPVAAPPPSRRARHGDAAADLRRLGLPYLRRTRKRAPRQLRLFEKPEPGDSVQVDVKFVRIRGRWAFQYTAIDDCTRFRVWRLYRTLNQASSLAFLREVVTALPFPIRRLQCDNGRKFPFEFALAVEAAGIRHRYIHPQRPQQKWQGGTQPPH